MHIPHPLKMIALGLTLSSATFAQSSIAASQTPPTVRLATAPPPVPKQLPTVTMSSRVRAFNAGLGGEICSLYLQNGSVVDLAPGTGVQLGDFIRKGERITVTGTESEFYGQTLVEAATVWLNEREFSASVPAPAPMADRVATPLPRAEQAAPASGPGRRPTVVEPAPCAAALHTAGSPSGLYGPLPPHECFRAGPAPAPSDGGAPPLRSDSTAPPPPQDKECP